METGCDFEKFLEQNIFTEKYIDDYNIKNNNKVVISSRIRLARNLENFPFPENCCEEELENVLQTVLLVTKYENKKSRNNFKRMFPYFFLLKNLKKENYEQLKNLHLITDRMAYDKNSTAVFINNEKNLSLMVNEEDHFRLQYLLPGLQFEKIWDVLNKFDDYLSGLVPFAFDKQFGFVTTSLANVGTGLRCSAMMHLIGISLTGKMESVTKAAEKLSMTIRGCYGEGSENHGHLFQISNKGSLGESEEQIIKRCQKFIDILLDYEINARNQLLVEDKIVLVDKIARAYGVLQNCYSLSKKECFELLSLLRLGSACNMFTKITINDVDLLFNAAISLKSADNEKIVNVVRAELVADLIKNLK